MQMSRSVRVFVGALVGSCWAACGGGGSGTGGAGGSGGTGGTGGAAGEGGMAGAAGMGGDMVVCGPDVDVAPETLGPGDDPEAGDFTLDEALDGLPMGDGPLRAVMETSLGTLTCVLRPDVAPNGVANFVGLARGRRAWKNGNSWERSRFYDGLTFHRVIDDFMAQGGDPLGTGFGGPGYQFDDEVGSLSHQPGTLAYANAGPDTNGSQFYITEIATDWLDGDYTIFGSCTPMDTVQTLTAVPTNANDKPVDPVYIVKVTITRCPE
jgi:peptidyl-prolyl cis-trans isomerase A (cyclophilin A)